MKKSILLVLAAVLTMGMTACGKDDAGNAGNNTQAGTEIGTEVNTEVGTEINTEVNTEANAGGQETVNILANVWATYGEEEKFFAMGGDMNNMVDNAPGAYSLEDEGLTATLYVPADSVALIDEAASLVHGMNLNTFTGAAFHVTDAANVETFVTALKENIMGTQWMCGFPDKLVIFTVNDQFVVSAFGNAEVIDNFKNKVETVYGEAAVVVVEENLM